MPKLLDGLTRETATSPRRGLLQAMAATAVAALAAAGRSPIPVPAGGKKKKDRCKKCPDSCGFIFHEVGGGKFCGTGNTTAQNPCQPCTSSSQCTNALFPTCIADFTIISTGERRKIGVCQPYTDGLCSGVFACRT